MYYGRDIFEYFMIKKRSKIEKEKKKHDKMVKFLFESSKK